MGPCNRALFPGQGGRDRWEGKWERPGKEKLCPESSIPLLCKGQGRSQDPVPWARYSCTESPVMSGRPNPAGSVRKLLQRTDSWVKLMIVLTFGFESKTNVLEQPSVLRVSPKQPGNALSDHASCRFRPDCFVHGEPICVLFLKCSLVFTAQAFERHF